ncbi:tryptophan-tRNA ligase [Plasmodium falciparum Santa Lucia]|uniref:tryptophan--tRNA ligase n=13 Tax=Plasmodium falciparum TaxID=5833 RepID=Q8IDW3_PLAF7|nr:tryptophan--tRNA ligase [Plasmodium falciparum 3D7]ETW16852.1 tryptophan-tRNA ligase [Plasmodium falciparum Vietnam Oak-Knoll (FVO)]ETW29454.1 tryptophan-tRNA ligase [Plasmodium falciparum FCH/4]ETW34677.1 tryptophan-tRNA ligase [Plasmodium falciparum Tanzania (2000708)]ETW40502.1 tryptophan-tRNA ligase [Plasmodium falciparum NF135/5.C10]ETW47471.1 tryptophan-tRNA ligase [Plasmodium falciparum MaliPS096_E11]ETW55510.1 tryptophan-tRNA ligase [Plasmodium falciparum Palo Alto/Uganda]ETW59415|eukprot:XP_001350097.1 tryptophan--tRNA ligase [Plasmodium falciparum 3D7]
MDKLKTIYLDSALSIIKGALCIILQIPTSRTTESVKKKANNVGVITVKSILSEPTIHQYDDIKKLIKNKLQECVPFYNYNMNRSFAEKIYGDCIYDNYGLSKEINEINLIILEEWNINCNKNRVLKNTGLIKEITINQFKYSTNKESLEVHFAVSPKYTFEELSTMYKNEKGLYEFLLSPIIKIICNENDKKLLDNMNEECTYLNAEDILPKNKVLPPSGIENIDYERSKDVTPWDVNINNEEGINYNKLIKEFGCSKITENHIKRIEKLTNSKAHHFIRRGIFFSHRDLDFLLNYYEQHKCFYIYTGRGPSSLSMHLGHLIPFYFCKYLQEAFNVPLVIQLSDDEKYLFNQNYSLEYINTLTNENVKDIISVGLNPELTFIFKNTEYAGYLYPTVLSIHKKTTLNQSMNVFGFNHSDNIGKISYPSFQIAPCFSQCFPNFLGKNIPCLVPQGIDQDPYFRLSRDIAVKMALHKPVVVHSVFMPGLQGVNSKMSSTKKKKDDNGKSNSTFDHNNSVIFLTDTPEQIKNKINKYAFSGGGTTIQEHREKGGNLDKDISYQYLRYLLEDDNKLNEIGEKYKKGEMLSGEIKKILIDVLTELVLKHQEKKKSLTDEEISYFFDPNKPSLQKFKNM